VPDIGASVAINHETERVGVTCLGIQRLRCSTSHHLPVGMDLTLPEKLTGNLGQTFKLGNQRGLLVVGNGNNGLNLLEVWQTTK
jgi:hypothetical protein